LSELAREELRKLARRLLSRRFGGFFDFFSNIMRTFRVLWTFFDENDHKTRKVRYFNL
jgi:hypothetical protein